MREPALRERDGTPVLLLRNVAEPRRLTVRAEQLPSGAVELLLSNLDTSTRRLLTPDEACALGAWLLAGTGEGAGHE